LGLRVWILQFRVPRFGVEGVGLRVRGAPFGLVFKAHRFLYHSTLGLRVIKKKKRLTFRILPIVAATPRLFLSPCTASLQTRATFIRDLDNLLESLIIDLSETLTIRDRDHEE